MSKIIVSGGAGFIGSNIVDALVAEKHNVLVLDNLSTGKIENINKKADFLFADICYFSTLQPIFEDFKPTYIFHLAALPRIQPAIKEPIKSHNVNVNGTLNLLELARHYKVKKFIYSASSSVYGDQGTLPLKEDMMPKPKNPYALQKLISEEYCRLYASLYGLPTVCLRYFNVWGNRQCLEGAYAAVVGIFEQQKSKGEPLTVIGDGTQKRDFTNVQDIVRANILAMKSKIKDGRAINIGTGVNITIKRLAELVGGKNYSIKYLPLRSTEIKETLADNSLAEKLLGWKPKIFIEDKLRISIFLINNQ